MDILSELRRVGQHLAGMAFMLALYCGLVGAGTAGAALGLAGVAALLAITAVGKSQSGIGLDGGEAEENDDLGLDEFQLENPR